jgi:hypothetical protein
MLVRSPRRFAILACVAFAFIFLVLQQSPWTRESVYERIPLFKSNPRPDQSPISNSNEPDLPQFEDAGHSAVPIATSSHVAPEKPVEVSQTPVASKTKALPPWVTAPSRTASFVPPTPRPTNMKEYMKKMLDWGRPSWDGHWPPFNDYVDKEYDPNRWEQFPMYVTPRDGDRYGAN